MTSGTSGNSAASQTSGQATVIAAGCVLWRHSPVGDGIELALVYRPKRDDWSFPKGKLEPGEALPDAAVREVREETGMTCALGAVLPTAHYPDQRGRPKEVHYWAAEATGGHFVPNSEVSQLLWLSPYDAAERLTYGHDRTLIPELLRALSGTPEGL